MQGIDVAHKELFFMLIELDRIGEVYDVIASLQDKAGLQRALCLLQASKLLPGKPGKDKNANQVAITQQVAFLSKQETRIVSVALDSAMAMCKVCLFLNYSIN